MEIVVEFLDGPLRDYLVFSDEDCGAGFEAILASGIYTQTKNGAVGKRFQIVSPKTEFVSRGRTPTHRIESDVHWYEITERIEVDGRVTLRTEYILPPSLD